MARFAPKPCLGWQDRDVVSQKVGDTMRVGRVVELRRHRDNGAFLMVQVLGGQREWPEGWMLGQGPREGRCLECGQGFWTNDALADFCPSCTRTDVRAVASVNSRAGMRRDLRGNATRTTRFPREMTPDEEAQLVKEIAEQ